MNFIIDKGRGSKVTLTVQPADEDGVEIGVTCYGEGEAIYLPWTEVERMRNQLTAWLDRRSQAGAMTDEELRGCIADARRIASMYGPWHQFWGVIREADAILGGRKSDLTRDQIEGYFKKMRAKGELDGRGNPYPYAF